MMENKKNGRPSFGEPGRPKGSGALAASADPNVQSIILSPSGQAAIADFLRPGAAQAVTLRELVRLTGRPERDVRLSIRAERLRGALIVSDNQRGYWLADDPAEAQRFARSMLHRSREITATALAVKAAADALEGAPAGADDDGDLPFLGGGGK